MKSAVYKSRRIANIAAQAFAITATLGGVAVLFAILTTLCVNGVEGLNLDLVTMMTPSAGSEGGLLNAIAGSLLMSGLGMAIAMPVGMLAGIYLAEYGRGLKISMVIRFLNDILLSAPSICIGMFVYELVVRPMHHFSGYAGAGALAIIAIPVIVRMTEDMLVLVPSTLREAAAALGAPRWHVICHICFRLARSGIVTGLLLATARIVGETAPLLFTALGNQFWSANMNAPMASLPVTIFQFAMSPYADWHRLAWAGALLVTMAVLALNIGARLITAPRRVQE
jgi:phosphate transport system permease protein